VVNAQNRGAQPALNPGFGFTPKPESGAFTPIGYFLRDEALAPGNPQSVAFAQYLLKQVMDGGTPGPHGAGTPPPRHGRQI